jgi:FkbM family methyltransferase
LPENHILPFLLQKNPKYDKFLPHLARYINRTETIIDIGANIGDTLANMAEVNSEPEFICIEPHEDFYNLLIENINRVKQSLLDLRVESHNVLIGKNITNVKLEGHPGTKSATVTDKDGLKSLTLDSLIPADKKVKLIKCDIDGFDYDAIESGINTIEKINPCFFSNVTLNTAIKN